MLKRGSGKGVAKVEKLCRVGSDFSDLRSSVGIDWKQILCLYSTWQVMSSNFGSNDSHGDNQGEAEMPL